MTHQNALESIFIEGCRHKYSIKKLISGLKSKIWRKIMKTNVAVVEKLRMRARGIRPRTSRTFCGNTGQVVSCRPGECYRIDGTCDHQHKILIAANRDIIRALKDSVIAKTPMLNMADRQALAIRDYGAIVGKLVALMLKYPALEKA
jgi:hypothetical protein